jgi:hypothetical protein
MIEKRFSAILSRWGTIVFVTLYPINLIRALILYVEQLYTAINALSLTIFPAQNLAH